MDDVCECCEEQPATRKLMLAEINGTLLSEMKLCADCLPGIHANDAGNDLIF